MSRRTVGMSLGAAPLLALNAAAVPADAAPHRPPGAQRVSAAADGRSVAFTSTAPSFGCADYFPCLRVKNLKTGAVTAIDSAVSYLVPGDTNGVSDVFVRRAS
ncbi:hypothetical protein OG226_16275 [Streptomyces sp. NBC_01261]|uniref:hypothetical protein n=1 Tax=Streptomyces sp. NBC_01261 TaxID=2903802 RepID=UPI002E34564F|nr:hypothetical protein [Streptomyces sp. NBC_01261]